MSEAEIENICNLASSNDIECKKLAISLIEQAFPNKLSYNDYLKYYQAWIFREEYKYFLDNYYYDFVNIGYMQYLQIKPLPEGKVWAVNFEDICMGG